MKTEVNELSYVHQHGPDRTHKLILLCQPPLQVLIYLDLTEQRCGWTTWLLFTQILEIRLLTQGGGNLNKHFIYPAEPMSLNAFVIDWEVSR